MWYEEKHDSPPVNIKNLFKYTSEKIKEKINKDKSKEIKEGKTSEIKANNLKSLKNLDKNLTKLDNYRVIKDIKMKQKI